MTDGVANLVDAPPQVAPVVPAVRRRWRVTVLDVLHVVALLAGVVLLRAGTDRWGWATLAAYAPRWPWLVPGGLLALVALVRGRVPWLTMAVLAGGGWVLLDAHAAWPSGGVAADGGLRLLTLNADGVGTAGRGTDLARIGRLIADVDPDVVLLQEWPRGDRPPLPPGDWHDRPFWGLHVCARHPILDTAGVPGNELGGSSNVFGVKLDLGGGRTVWVFDVHLETPRGAFDKVERRAPGALAFVADNARHRRDVSEQAVAFVRRTAGDGDVVVAGDFNLVADGRIFAGTWGRWADAFAAVGFGTGGTKLQTGWRPRIDHVLTGGDWFATACRVGPDVGSDHLPLIADLRTGGGR